jgi:hypothetical protein
MSFENTKGMRIAYREAFIAFEQIESTPRIRRARQLRKPLLTRCQGRHTHIG